MKRTNLYIFSLQICFFFLLFGNKLTDRWHFAIDPSVTSLLVRFTRGTVTLLYIYICILSLLYTRTSVIMTVKYREVHTRGEVRVKKWRIGDACVLAIVPLTPVFSHYSFFRLFVMCFFLQKKKKVNLPLASKHLWTVDPSAIGNQPWKQYHIYEGT